MSAVRQSTIKAIVTNDFRAAAVFERFGLDFCCRGGVTVDEACKDRGIDPSKVYAELEGLPLAEGHVPRYENWALDELAAHIVGVHHAYVRGAIPVLQAHTQKVAEVHGANHPEVVEIARHFETVAAEMEHHMFKEEQILFPYIRVLAAARRVGGKPDTPPFGTIRNPIRMMEQEHQAAGDAMASIRKLSGTYTPPADACTTYRVSFHELRQFEEDLHQHVHLENNILFPGAIALEENFAGVPAR